MAKVLSIHFNVSHRAIAITDEQPGAPYGRTLLLGKGTGAEEFIEANRAVLNALTAAAHAALDARDGLDRAVEDVPASVPFDHCDGDGDGEGGAAWAST